MSMQLTIKLLRSLSALGLLAILLAGTPIPAQAAGAVLCSANSAVLLHAPRAQDSPPHQAGLVIDFGGGRVLTFCIDLGADGQATGEELLRATNLPVIFEYSGGIGGAVCKIDTVGSNFPTEPCFSHCTLQPGETCMYWSYSQLVGDHWQFSQIGASSIVVHSGDVNGWAWGESTIAHGAQPPLRTLAEICLPATATPTASATPTLITLPTALPTATPPPTAPPATTTPYVARIITATPTASRTPTSTPTTPPVAAPLVPTSAPAQADAPTALPVPSPTTAATLQPPTAIPSATPLPPPSTAPADPSDASVAAATPANRSIGGSLRIQLPLIQQAAAAVPTAITPPTTRVSPAPAIPSSATTVPAATIPTPTLPSTPADDPTRNYPYFGGMSVFLLAGWLLLRRGRRTP